MKWKLVVILAVVLVAAVVGVMLVGKRGSRPAVKVTLRVAVSPREQLDAVIAQANSARFKYMAGKDAGMKPSLAQQLSVKPVPNAAILEAQIGVAKKEDGQHYAEVFVGVLQELCGDQVKLSLDSRKIE
jgi:hypothetical protein